MVEVKCFLELEELLTWQAAYSHCVYIFKEGNEGNILGHFTDFLFKMRNTMDHTNFDDFLYFVAICLFLICIDLMTSSTLQVATLCLFLICIGFYFNFCEFSQIS